MTSDLGKVKKPRQDLQLVWTLIPVRMERSTIDCGNQHPLTYSSGTEGTDRGMEAHSQWPLSTLEVNLIS